MRNPRRTHDKGKNKQIMVDNKELEHHVQKDLLEAPQSEKDEFEKRRKELQDETQNFMYHQSSKFSSVSRTLVLGIIGTIWVITYTDGNLCIPNIWLFVSLLLGLSFLTVDVIHYFWDSMSYHEELYNLDDYTSMAELNEKHEPKMNEINKRSHIFIKIKFWVLIIAALFFLLGILMKTSIIKLVLGLIINLFSNLG